MINFIKNLDLSNYRKISSLLKHNNELLTFCTNYITKYPSLEKPIYVLYFIQNNNYLPRCKHCNKLISYKKYIQQHAEYCSISCAKNNKPCKNNLKNKFNKMKNLFKPYVEPLFTSNEYKGRAYTYKWKCKFCNKIFNANLITCTKFMENITGNKQLKRLPRCPYCFKKYQNFSKEENNLVNFCKQYFNNIQTHKQNIIKPFEIDIYIPEIKLGIEFNGVFWHDINHKSIGYHQNKIDMCNKLGIRLIHIWEDEWLINNILIKERLKLIFFNKEQFTNNILILNNEWYNNLNLPNYKLIQKIQPTIISRLNKQCETCGFSVYKKETNFR